MMSKGVAEAAEPDSTLFGVPPATVRLSSFPHADLSRTPLSQPSNLLMHKEKPFNRHHCSKWHSVGPLPIQAPCVCGVAGEYKEFGVSSAIDSKLECFEKKTVRSGRKHS